MAAMIGSRLATQKNGVETFDRYMKAFGLGTETGSGLPYEHLGVRDYIREAERKRVLSALVYASFGQQGKYTALQLAQFTATLANKGKRLKPLFVDHVSNANGKILYRTKPEILNTVEAPDRYWDIVRRGMNAVSSVGRVRDLFKDLPHEVASKTGTSQSDIAGKFIENAVFIAYAPSSNPTLAVAVVVPEGGYGAWNAAPIASKIFDAYDVNIGLAGTPRTPPPTVEEKKPAIDNE
jgi:penicillin-binding protein 2